MSEAFEITGISKRLRELADGLREPELSDEGAEALAREAADLVAEAGNAIERALRSDGAGDEA